MAGVTGLLLTGVLAVAGVAVPQGRVLLATAVNQLKATVGGSDADPGIAPVPAHDAEDAPVSPVLPVAAAWPSLGDGLPLSARPLALPTPGMAMAAGPVERAPEIAPPAPDCQDRAGAGAGLGAATNTLLPPAGCGFSLLAVAPAKAGVAAAGPVAPVGGMAIVPASVSVQPYAAAPAIQAAHPRLLLDAATLARMRADAAANTSEWKALKATCDAYIGGQVNYPTGAAYPNKPDLGSGYQGEEYLPAVLAEGLCYQALKTSNPSAAATYGAKGVDILLKMSTPFTSGGGNQGQDPCTDSGYGIRNYGVGFGLGYDWLYDLLTPGQRTQVYTTANAWIVPYETPGGCANFAYTNPQSNYYAGYFHAKAVLALATYGDNPSAPAAWDDWYNNQFAKRVQPYYAQHLAGGGWPEGYGNYATPAIMHMNLPAREVKTATGVDPVNGSAPFRFPIDSATYAMHFTWPSRAYFDDRDFNHANGTANPPVGTPWVRLFQQNLGALNFWGSSLTGVANQYLADVIAATSNYSPAPPWLAFLNGSPGALPTAAVDTLPLSYLAAGMGAVAARSDWSTAASWMSFRAAPYTNNPNQGEQGFDEGSLALAHGNTPLLVNTWGWMVHEPNGAADEERLYADLYNKFDGTPYSGNRQIYNLFYVRRMSGSSVQEPYGQGMYTSEGDHASTKVAAFEDHGGYVFVQATGLADMYRPFAAGPAVSSWTRQIVFLRPNRFVVYDRTAAGSSGYDQYLAWHFPANPAAATAPAGQNRLDVTYNGVYAGAMTTVLPAGARLTTVPLYPASSPVKVWQVQERPADTAAAQSWLTVFDMSASAGAVATAAPVTVSQGNMTGVMLSATGGNSVVLQSAAPAGTPVAGTVAYTVPAKLAQHVLTELAPGTGYNVTAAAGGSGLVITVSPGGTFVTSQAGVLGFYVDAGGTIQAQAPAQLTVPVSSLPVPGYPQPYQP